MSGTTETEMQIQIVTHGEAFCPSTMTKETPFSSRKLLLEEITNNERNEVEEEQMEEIEIIEGHEDVEEEQDNKAEETPIANQKLLLEKITNNERNGMEEEIEIKEGHENGEKEQDNEILNNFDDQCLDDFDDMWPRLLRLMGIGKSSFLYCSRSRYTFGGVTEEEQMEEYKKKERQKKNKKTFERFMKIRRWMQFRGGQSRRKLFFRKGRNKRVQRESEKLRQYLEIWGRNAMMQHTAPQQREHFFNITKDHGGFDDAEKVRGKRAICADCHLESRPGHADNLFVVHAEWRGLCPIVVNAKKRNAGQTNDAATQTVPVLEPGEDIFRRNAITQHAAPQQRGKLNDIAEDQCEFDDTEKGGEKRTVCAICQLQSRPGQVYDLSELHAGLTPNCPFENVKKRDAGQTNDVATQTVPVREPVEDIFRINDMTQHAAPPQRGKLIDITEDHRGFDDAEKEILELEQLLRCKVCLDCDACIVFFPCRHMATCENCEGFLHCCPVCRSFIEEAVKINEE